MSEHKQSFDNDSAPLVTVAIPVYCGSCFIERTMNSVLMQTYSNIELLIIDDKSTDNSENIIRGFGDSRIRFLRHAYNQGAAATWNHCLSEARGIYFKLLPQDDILYDDAIMQQVSILEGDAKQRIALIFGARVVIDKNDRHIFSRKLGYTSDQIISSNTLVKLCVRSGTNIIGEPGAGLVRTATARKVGGYSDGFPYVIDLAHWFKVLECGDGYYQKTPISKFRVSTGAWSRKLVKQQYSDFNKLLDVVKANGRFPISKIDMIIGKSMSYINNILRSMIYKYLSMI